MRLYLLLIIFTLALLACNKRTISVIAKGQIVLIFEQCPSDVNGKHTFPSKVTAGTGYEIRYVDDDMIPQLISPKYAPHNDTIIITTHKPTLEIVHAFRGIDAFSFNLNRGDSVVFSYPNNIPTAKIKNRVTLPYDVNYESEKIGLLCKGDFPEMVKYYVPELVLLDPLRMIDFGTKDTDGLSKRAKAEFEYDLESRFLDSLAENKLISPSLYNFYTTKSKYNIYKIRISENEFDLHKIKEITGAGHDSLLAFSFYREILEHIVNHTYTLHAPVRSRLGKGSGYSGPDLKMVFDSIVASKLFTEPARKYLLLQSLMPIIETSSADDISAYVEKYSSKVRDSVYDNYIKQKYKLGEAPSDELKLKTLDSQRLSFAHLVQKYRGKLLYIDFWASWCAPCIRALPASHRLRERYQDQDIVFIYISKDENYDYWIQGARKHGLDKVHHSYIIDNLYTSRLLEDLEITTIPRYLLYDKSGKLVHKNAPGPESAELLRLIDGLL